LISTTQALCSKSPSTCFTVGYNFYRIENQLRADDLLVRSKVSWLLGIARPVSNRPRAATGGNLSRRRRGKAYPDPKAVANAQSIERLSRAIGSLEVRFARNPFPKMIG